MDGKIILEEHFSTEFNNQFWDADGENQRNGDTYAQDVARRLLDTELCLAEMDQAGIDHCVLSLTSPGVQSVGDTRERRANSLRHVTIICTRSCSGIRIASLDSQRSQCRTLVLPRTNCSVVWKSSVSKALSLTVTPT